MKNLILITLAITLAACGSTISGKQTMDVEGTECGDVGFESPCSIEECDGVQSCEPDKHWGECVCDDTSSGGHDGSSGGSNATGGDDGKDTGGSKSTGGSDNTGGDGGKDTGGQPSTGGVPSTGGETSTGGMGGNTGGTGGASGGSMNTGGSGGGCVPKTCDEFSIEMTGKAGLACGDIPDGCGGEIYCSFDCNGDANAQCRLPIVTGVSGIGINTAAGVLSSNGSVIPDYIPGEKLEDPVNVCTSEQWGGGPGPDGFVQEICPEGDWDTLVISTHNRYNNSEPYLTDKILNSINWVDFVLADVQNNEDYTYWCAK